MAGWLGWSSTSTDAQGLQLSNAEGINNNNKILLNKSCITQFLVSQGNRAERKKQYLKFGGLRHFHSHIKTQVHFLSATIYDASTELRTIQGSVGFFQGCYPSRGYSAS